MNLIERLSLKHSIFLAPMAGVSTPELAAEVSNAGALGSLGLGANTVEQAREQILKTQQLTRQPFQLNFFVIALKYWIRILHKNGLNI